MNHHHFCAVHETQPMKQNIVTKTHRSVVVYWLGSYEITINVCLQTKEFFVNVASAVNFFLVQLREVTSFKMFNPTMHLTVHLQFNYGCNELVRCAASLFD